MWVLEASPPSAPICCDDVDADARVVGLGVTSSSPPAHLLVANKTRVPSATLQLRLFLFLFFKWSLCLCWRWREEEGLSYAPPATPFHSFVSPPPTPARLRAALHREGGREGGREGRARSFYCFLPPPRRSRFSAPSCARRRASHRGGGRRTPPRRAGSAPRDLRACAPPPALRAPTRWRSRTGS
jgi:hypothetical protein